MTFRNALASVFAMMLFSASSLAFTPLTGHWWNPNESGSGFNIDIQNGVLVVTVYSYKSNGDSEWYLASGAMTPDQRSFTGTLDKYRNGQCISCAYAGRPIVAGNDGTISITFNSETSATVRLPGGRVSTIQPFNFAFGEPLGGLLGQWVFVYDIITTWADRYTFTRIGTSTDGTSFAVDDSARAGCTYETSGKYAGKLLCLELDSTGKTTNIFVWRYGLSETFDGVRVSPTTFSEYSMKGFRVKSKNGATKSLALDTSTEQLSVVRNMEEDKSAVVSIARQGGDAEVAEIVNKTRLRILEARRLAE